MQNHWGIRNVQHPCNGLNAHKKLRGPQQSNQNTTRSPEEFNFKRYYATYASSEKAQLHDVRLHLLSCQGQTWLAKKNSPGGEGMGGRQPQTIYAENRGRGVLRNSLATQGGQPGGGGRQKGDRNGKISQKRCSIQIAADFCKHPRGAGLHSLLVTRRTWAIYTFALWDDESGRTPGVEAGNLPDSAWQLGVGTKPTGGLEPDAPEAKIFKDCICRFGDWTHLCENGERRWK